MNKKSELAFRSTANRFADYCRNLDTGVYYWTFTLRRHYKDYQAPYIFSRFMRMVQDKYRHDDVLFGGLRVIERQKKNHGRPHWHALVNKRIPIDWMEDAGWPLGLGWMWVEEVKSYKAVTRYLEKYFSKDFDSGFERLGMPVWGTIGHAPFRTVSTDIRIETPATRFMSRLRKEVFGDLALPNWLARHVHSSHHVGYPEREDFIVFHARRHDLSSWKAWETLTYPEWLMQQEIEGIGERDLDGRLPF